MKKSEPISLGDVLRLTIQESNLSGPLDEQRAIELWRPYVGDALADRCGRPSVRSGIMSISVPAAALRHELTMSRSTIIRYINNTLGKNVISDIRFTG